MTGAAHAAALLAGFELWAPPALQRNKKKCAEILFPLAKRLGADVPFFLLGGTAKAPAYPATVVPPPLNLKLATASKGDADRGGALYAPSPRPWVRTD